LLKKQKFRLKQPTFLLKKQKFRLKQPTFLLKKQKFRLKWPQFLLKNRSLGYSGNTNFHFGPPSTTKFLEFLRVLILSNPTNLRSLVGATRLRAASKVQAPLRSSSRAFDSLRCTTSFAKTGPLAPFWAKDAAQRASLALGGRKVAED
jgi:hypothetical protein